MSITIEKPAPLDQDRYYTRAERLAYSKQLAAYEASLREAEKPPVKAEPEQPTVRTLTDAEYDELRRKEWEADRARRRERDEAAKAAAKAKQDYLESEPAQANVSAMDPFSFLLDFQHRVLQGYRLPDDGMGPFNHGYYSVTMTKPTTTAPRKK